MWRDPTVEDATILVALLGMLAAFCAAFVGLFSPRRVLPKWAGSPTRVKAFGGHLLASFVLLTLAAMLVPAENRPSGSDSDRVAAPDTATSAPERRLAAAPEPEPDPEPEPGPQPPQTQREAIALVDEYAVRYAEAENELKKSRVHSQRDEALKALLGSPTRVDEWVGTIEEMGTNGDGHAYVSIRVSDRLSFQTWSNAFSDMGSETLIRQSHPLFDVLAELEEGTTVVFSGLVLAESSLTEAGSASEPELITRFDLILPADEFAREFARK